MLTQAESETPVSFNYGILIVIITIVTRVFVVSIAWSYGIFVSALKKTYPEAYFVELGEKS
jgi:hypothetical protein